jgi:hypothetical protein
MTELTLHVFEPGHLQGMELAPAFTGGDFVLSPEYATALKDMGPGFSAFADDNCLGCCGMALFWPGVAQGWMFLAVQAEKHTVGVRRLMKRGIAMMLDKYSLHRLQATCRTNNLLAYDWLCGRRRKGKNVGGLGFSPEAVMRGYGPDKEDHYLLALTRF